MRTEGAEDSVLLGSWGMPTSAFERGWWSWGSGGRGRAVRSTQGWGLSVEPNRSLC